MNVHFELKFQSAFWKKEAMLTNLTECWLTPKKLINFTNKKVNLLIDYLIIINFFSKQTLFLLRIFLIKNIHSKIIIKTYY